MNETRLNEIQPIVETKKPTKRRANRKQLDFSQNRYSTYSSSTITSSDVSSSKATEEGQPKSRQNSVQLGRQALSELLDNHNVSNAIQILQNAMDHLQNEECETDQVSTVYSDILKSLCDPQVSTIINEMSKQEGKPYSTEDTIMWRLFKKVVLDSGFTLERGAYLAVVDTLVEENSIPLALKAMYSLPRTEWDTRCYHAAVLIHLLHRPLQVQEAQNVVLDYGLSYLAIPNPSGPTELPPIRIDMPLMEEITDDERSELLQFYQHMLDTHDPEWHQIRLEYETKRKENLERLETQEEGIKEWALSQLSIETVGQQLDRECTEQDNQMIKTATERQQYIYGWYVFEAMADAVDERTPYLVMHMCWKAFVTTPLSDIVRRAYWEKKGFEVYSRFMCSEYLHPDQRETPVFLHDVLSIVSQSPEVLIDKRARLTKSMSIYQLLVRLEFETLLCDERVLEPILCCLLSDRKEDNLKISEKGIEILDRMIKIFEKRKKEKKVTLSMLWGLIILCLDGENRIGFDKLLDYLFSTFKLFTPSILAPIQTFHDLHLCEGCYFENYLFQFIEFTDENNQYNFIIDQYGFLNSSKHMKDIKQNISSAVIMGVKSKERLVPKQMYYSTKKAKALIRHCLMKSKKI